MKALFKKLVKLLAYLAAGAVILLAVAVGLFRLLLPRLPAYQEEIKGWATAAIGMEVEFSGMNARWRFSGPELNFYNAELEMPSAEGDVLAADEVSVGIDVMQLLLERQLVVDRILVRDSTVSVRRDGDGRWRLQDIPLPVLAERFGGGRAGGEITFVAEDFDVTYQHPPNGEVLQFTVDSLNVTRSPARVAADAELLLPATLGSRLSLTAGGTPARGGRPARWNLTLDSRGLELAGWSGLQPPPLPALQSGRADLSASIERTGSRITNAIVDFEVENLLAEGNDEPFGGEGRLEYQRDAAGWLLAAEELRLESALGIWPESRLSLQGATGADGELTSLSAEASYLQAADLGRLLPWLPARAAEPLLRYRPTGEVTGLSLSLAELPSERPRYDVSLELSEAGIAATDSLPGVSGFSGSLRANRSGGRVEIASADLVLGLDRWLEAPVALSSAQGTVIWRQNADGTIVLSDSIRVQNDDLTSRSSVQLSLPADGSSPVLDLESRWSVYDVARARKYLPAPLLDPRLYNWLEQALVAGSVPAGVTRFSGPLDRFPFDDGEGEFRIEAEFEDATLSYSDQWPLVENLDMTLIVDRTRLYSVRNTAINAGNTVIDAEIEIADLRRPVLTIDAFATGTLQSVRRLARESPIARVFGGQLDRISVSGDASFSLDLTYPILRRQDFEFETRLQATDGTLRIQGFNPPVTEVSGFVTVTRDSIASESLGGRLFGEPVTIELSRAGDAEPGYGVVAEAAGRFSVGGLSSAFDLPLAGVLEGGSDYRAELLFPQAGSESPSPFTIRLSSELEGLAASLPEPLAKPRGSARALDATIEFPGGDRIETRGSLDDFLRFALAFTDSEAGWDFDRGVVAVGGVYPGTAGTRGLHITGDLPVLDLSRWLAIAERGGGDGGLGERIRSIDLNVADLYALGQHLTGHRVLADRSGQDWVLRLDGDSVRGTVSIPYELDGERPVALDMERLVLPGDDEEAGGAPTSTDPRRLPAVSVRAAEFALGNRFLGRIEAEFEKTPDGLVAESITTEDEAFSMTGSAGWVVDTAEPSGQRTWVRAELESNDVEATMERLDYRPGIEGDELTLAFDVSWSGGPREDFLASLDGNVDVRFGTGRLNEVEPGAGRVFGLLSVVALPRRLALDFRDVLEEGFTFDEITGTFRLEDGAAYTCDLSLKGPAADIGIVGRAGLVDRDYTQTAIVSANVGNTLPVVGAVVAGPQVAAALLIFSQIFKKPLQEMGQIYYAIEGSWSDPAVETANPQRFAEVSRMAGCLEGEG